ncbi:hypothetical protein DPMN_098959 [Dreissena polymorpha]|uniref:Uncharacterized protein n=1 Tax=Dreissena polymorpha TaxID=45954 RepID=A0A9D4LD28_DREPO|nr:hypothetical protein DPMN_098959 [Dreissena polymorpha]
MSHVTENWTLGIETILAPKEQYDQLIQHVQHNCHSVSASKDVKRTRGSEKGIMWVRGGYNGGGEGGIMWGGVGRGGGEGHNVGLRGGIMWGGVVVERDVLKNGGGGWGRGKGIMWGGYNMFKKIKKIKIWRRMEGCIMWGEYNMFKKNCGRGYNVGCGGLGGEWGYNRDVYCGVW